MTAYTLYRLPVLEKKVFRIHICALHRQPTPRPQCACTAIATENIQRVSQSLGHADEHEALQDLQPEYAGLSREHGGHVAVEPGVRTGMSASLWIR